MGKLPLFLHPVNYFRDILFLLFYPRPHSGISGSVLAGRAPAVRRGLCSPCVTTQETEVQEYPALRATRRTERSDPETAVRRWRIEYDNQRYLQATNRKGIPYLDCDLLILSWRNDEIRWALVYDPWYNIAGGIFTFNRYGRKTVKAIKALAAEPAETPAPRKLG